MLGNVSLQSLIPSRPGFSGHETFAFRYGWLPKALMGAEFSGQFFSQPFALVSLGVGKNMVQSIRYWGLATQILQEVGRAEIAPSALGKELLSRWDPFLEDAASLWLLHWWLVSNPAKAAAWHYAFFLWPRQEFSKAELTDTLSEWAERQATRAKRSTIERDVDCLLRTYLPGKSGKKGAAEESFDCPLVELGLLRPLRDGDRYAFVMGSKRTLPAAIFGYAMLDYLQSAGGGRQTVALQDLLYNVGSPGQAFKLSENAVVEYLEALEINLEGAIELDDTAGLKQVYLRRTIEPREILEQFYSDSVSGEPV
jgi:Protein of unknown function (DUF4007)